jgi:hypothetical protein
MSTAAIFSSSSALCIRSSSSLCACSSSFQSRSFSAASRNRFFPSSPLRMYSSSCSFPFSTFLLIPTNRSSSCRSTFSSASFSRLLFSRVLCTPLLYLRILFNYPFLLCILGLQPNSRFPVRSGRSIGVDIESSQYWAGRLRPGFPPFSGEKARP